MVRFVSEDEKDKEGDVEKWCLVKGLDHLNVACK